MKPKPVPRMKSELSKLLRGAIGHGAFHRFLMERPTLATLLQWCSGIYLRRYSGIDSRYFRWLYCLERTKDLEGDIVELGIGPGRFLIYCGTWMKAAGSAKTYWGYDTFRGFPSVSQQDIEGALPERIRRIRPGMYGFYNKKRIERLVDRLSLRNITLVEGDFTKLLKQVRPEKISFLYIDCDLYEGYKAALETLYDRVVPDGIILFDEYEWPEHWPGARRAVDEFFSEKPEKPERLFFSTSYVVVRGRVAPSTRAPASLLHSSSSVKMP